MKPLTSEDINENESKAAFAKIFDKTTTKLKIKEEKSTELNRDSKLSFEKLPKANETFMDMYKAPACSTSDSKIDLFSGLNQVVKSIDFNNFPTDHLSEVTIHKRNRLTEEKISQNSSEHLSDLFDAPKKKKYKIVPNNYVSPPSKNSQSAPSTENKPPENSINVLNTTSELPKDRRELLKFVRSEHQTL